jgi:hypothetical protein
MFRRIACLTALLALATIAPIANATSKIVRQGREAMMNVVNDELSRIDAIIALPPMAVASFDTREKDAVTVITAEPVKTVIVVEEWRFWYEPTIRRLAAHESYHALAASHGWSQDERLADLFAECYSSVGTRTGRDCSGVDRLVESVRR